MTVAHQELAKLHFINSLFADSIGPDPYFAQQVKSAIESALEQETEPGLFDENFTRAAVQLLENHYRQKPRHGFAHWTVRGDATGFDPLWARHELIALFKKLAPYPASTVLVTNLRAVIQPPGKRASQALRAEYAEAIRYIQELARTWSTSRAEVTLLFF